MGNPSESKTMVLAGGVCCGTADEVWHRVRCLACNGVAWRWNMVLGCAMLSIAASTSGNSFQHSTLFQVESDSCIRSQRFRFTA
ncbi:hypothetical protein Tco_1381808 [Tanacetum coccineum]